MSYFALQLNEILHPLIPFKTLPEVCDHLRDLLKLLEVDSVDQFLSQFDEAQFPAFPFLECGMVSFIEVSDYYYLVTKHKPQFNQAKKFYQQLANKSVVKLQQLRYVFEKITGRTDRISVLHLAWQYVLYQSYSRPELLQSAPEIDFRAIQLRIDGSEFVDFRQFIATLGKFLLKWRFVLMRLARQKQRFIDLLNGLVSEHNAQIDYQTLPKLSRAQNLTSLAFHEVLDFCEIVLTYLAPAGQNCSLNAIDYLICFVEEAKEALMKSILLIISNYIKQMANDGKPVLMKNYSKADLYDLNLDQLLNIAVRLEFDKYFSKLQQIQEVEQFAVCLSFILTGQVRFWSEDDVVVMLTRSFDEIRKTLKYDTKLEFLKDKLEQFPQFAGQRRDHQKKKVLISINSLKINRVFMDQFPSYEGALFLEQIFDFLTEIYFKLNKIFGIEGIVGNVEKLAIQQHESEIEVEKMEQLQQLQAEYENVDRFIDEDRQRELFGRTFVNESEFIEWYRKQYQQYAQAKQFVENLQASLSNYRNRLVALNHEDFNDQYDDKPIKDKIRLLAIERLLISKKRIQFENLDAALASDKEVMQRFFEKIGININQVAQDQKELSEVAAHHPSFMRLAVEAVLDAIEVKPLQRGVQEIAYKNIYDVFQQELLPLITKVEESLLGIQAQRVVDAVKDLYQLVKVIPDHQFEEIQLQAEHISDTIGDAKLEKAARFAQIQQEFKEIGKVVEHVKLKVEELCAEQPETSRQAAAFLVILEMYGFQVKCGGGITVTYNGKEQQME